MGSSGPSWALGSPGPSGAGPLWAPLGACGVGPCGAPWALVGRALADPPQASGPFWSWLLWAPWALGGRALVGWAFVGPPN